MKAKKVAELGLLTAAAIILGWVEHMLPVVPSVPGIKLGLGNIAVMLTLYRMGGREAALVSAAKVLLSALMFGGFSGLIYSASGALLSFVIMLILHKRPAFSPIGVSAAGGAAHVTAQVLAAMLLTMTPQLWTLIAPLLAVGTLTGALNGYLCSLLLSRMRAINE